MTPLLPESRSSGGARPIRYIRRDGHLRIARQQQQQRHVNTLAAPCQIMKTAVLMVVVALSIWEDGGLVAVRHVSGTLLFSLDCSERLMLLLGSRQIRLDSAHIHFLLHLHYYYRVSTSVSTVCQ